MTNHVARLYALATSLIVFFAVWLAVSAHPWSQTAKAAPAADPQLARLNVRERQLRAETRRVNLIVNRRYAAYRRALGSATASSRRRAHATTPSWPPRTRRRSRPRAGRERARIRSAVAAPPAVRIVTLPPVASTRTS